MMKLEVGGVINNYMLVDLGSSPDKHLLAHLPVNSSLVVLALHRNQGYTHACRRAPNMFPPEETVHHKYAALKAVRLTIETKYQSHLVDTKSTRKMQFPEHYISSRFGKKLLKSVA